MNYYVIPLLLTLALIFTEGCFVYFKNRHAATNFVYSLLCLSLCVWLLTFSGMYLSPDPKTAVLWCRSGLVGIVFIPSFAYHFVLAFLGKKRDFFLTALYAVSGVALLIAPSDLIYKEVTLRFWGYYPIAGIFYPYFILSFVGAFGYAIIQLLQRLDNPELSPAKRTQTKYMLAGFLIGSTGIVDYLSKMPGVNIYPWGWLATMIFLTLFALAVVKYHLLDIEVVIRRTVVFAGLFTFVYGTFAVVVIRNPWISTVPTAIFILLALRPLKNILTDATERFLFQKKYDARELLRAFTNEILTVLDLKELTEITIKDLVKIMKLESASILLYNKFSKDYRLAAGIGVKMGDVYFKDTDLLISYLKKSGQAILQDKNTDKMKGDHPLKESFKKLNARLCLPISLHDDFIGVLCMGMKKSGEDYTQEDIDILSTLARTEAIAISNAQLFSELTKMQAEVVMREKMAVIGTLAAGINHEICNPLSIVRGECEIFLLNHKADYYQKKSREDMIEVFVDIARKVIRETDRAAAITKRLSSFARPASRMVIEPVSVAGEIEEVLSLMTHDLTMKNIRIHQLLPADFPMIFCDRKQVQEVFFNILRNSIQRSDKYEGEITVSGAMENELAVVCVKDNGEGMPPEKIDHIFNPFFTARETGKATDLGLYVVKQIMERNKGAISVTSEAGVGSIFTLRFPTKRP